MHTCIKISLMHTHRPIPTTPTQHQIVEYYSSYTRRAKDAIAMIIDQPLPSLHVQTDLWSVPVTRTDLLGFYITFLNKNMDAEAHLLAARHFLPTPTMKAKGAELLLLYAEDIAEQYGFSLHQHVFSFTTDAGSNIRKFASSSVDRSKRIKEIRAHLAELKERAEGVDSDDEFAEMEEEAAAALADLEAELEAVAELLEALGPRPFWMWCKCHEAHLSCVDGTGIDIMDSKKTGSNPEMQDMVQQMVDFSNSVNSSTVLRMVFEAAQLADLGRTPKLRSVVKQRWASLAKLMKRIWQSLKPIEAAVREQKVDASQFLFLAKEGKALLLELYSIIKPVADYIERSQASMARTRRPVIVAAQWDLVGLRTGVLNVDEPLVIIDPDTDQPLKKKEKKDGQVVEVVDEREQWRLSDVAQRVRRLLADGFDKRGLKAQYTTVEYYHRSADMAMFLYPAMADLSYIDDMVELYGVSSLTAISIKLDVERRVERMVELAIKRERKAKAAAASTTPAPATRIVNPFKRVPTPKASAAHFLKLGLLRKKGGAGARAAGGNQERDAAVVAREIVAQYKKDAAEAAAVPEAFVAECPPDHVNDWWKTQPEGPLKAVARAVLGQAASSAPLENSFSTGSDICTRRRAGLAPERVEMLLVNGLMRRIITLTPDDVEQIPEDEIDKHLPARFTRKELITDLEAFGKDLLRAAEEATGEEDEGPLEFVEDLELLAPWSSLAAWGVGELDLDRIDAEMGMGDLNLDRIYAEEREEEGGAAPSK